MKKLCLIGVLGMLFMMPSFGDVKVGVVNLEQVAMESSQFKNAEEKFKKQFEKEEGEIAADQKNLNKLIEEFGKNSPTMKEEEKKAQQNKITDEHKKLQEKQIKLQKRVGEQSNRLRRNIMNQLETATQKVAVAQELDIVLPKGIALYVKEEVDITNKVLDLLNKK